MFTRSSFNVHIRSLTSRLTASPLPLLAGVLLAGLVLGPADRVRAQAGGPAESEAVAEAATNMPKSVPGAAIWQAHFGKQAAAVLRGKGPKIDRTIMRDLIVVAETGQRGIDLSAAIGPLLHVVQQAASEEQRLVAVQALHLIGTEHSSKRLYGRAMKQLYRIVREEPPGRVRQAAAAVLKDFYGEKK